MSNAECSDELLIETMRAEFAGVRLSAPVQDVVARGRRLRRWRTWSAVGGTAAVAAVVALSLSLAAPGVQPGHRTHVVLAAWSVTSGPGRTVSLTIRDQTAAEEAQAMIRKALQQAGAPVLAESAVPRACGRLWIQAHGPFAISRHHGAFTITIRLAKLPKGSRVAIVLPALEFTRGHAHEVRIPLGTVHMQVFAISKVATSCITVALTPADLSPPR